MGDTIKLEIVNIFICNSIINTFGVLDMKSIASRQTQYGKSENYLLINKKRLKEKTVNASLRITICKNTGYVRIFGSFRKWYFGKNSLQDFKYKKQFKKAVCLLAEALGVDKDVIMRMKIKRFDIGYNLRFRSDFAFNFFTNNNVEERIGNIKYYGTGFEEVYQQYKVTMYNKLVEMNTKGNRFKGAKILAKQMSFVRAEVQLERKDIIEKILKGVCNFYGVLKYWNELKCFWIKTFLKIKFENNDKEVLINPERIKLPKDITKWMIVVGLKAFGLSRLKAFVDYYRIIATSPKSRYFKKLDLLIAEFVSKKSDEVKEFKKKVASLNNIPNSIQ